MGLEAAIAWELAVCEVEGKALAGSQVRRRRPWSRHTDTGGPQRRVYGNASRS
jgi:hypothetical protein